MNHKSRSIVLHMVMAFVICILMVQLWLFTEAVDSMHSPDGTTALAAMICSGAGCIAIWLLIRYFLAAEKKAFD